MESQKIDALRFLVNPQQCVLPLYQRPYSWEKNVECKVLFENLFIPNDSIFNQYLHFIPRLSNSLSSDKISNNCI